LRELIPTLAPQAFDTDVGIAKNFECERIDPSARHAACAMCSDIFTEFLSQMIQHPLSENAASGIVSAQDENMSRHIAEWQS